MPAANGGDGKLTPFRLIVAAFAQLFLRWKPRVTGLSDAAHAP